MLFLFLEGNGGFDKKIVVQMVDGKGELDKGELVKQEFVKGELVTGELVKGELGKENHVKV